MPSREQKLPAAMPGKYKFRKGEKVLCIHGPLMYEAKCLEVEAKSDDIRYYLHYAGWNKRWDEWVPENQVLKYNEANVQKQKQLQEAQEAKPRARKRSLKSGGNNSESHDSASPPLVEKPRGVKNKAPASMLSSSQDSSSDDVPQNKKLSARKKSSKSGGNNSESHDSASSPLAEKPKIFKNKAPASMPSSSLDSSDDVPQNKKLSARKKSSKSGGNNSESHDSASPPLAEKPRGVKNKAPASMLSSSQDSSSDDVPQNKKLRTGQWTS